MPLTHILTMILPILLHMPLFCYLQMPAGSRCTAVSTQNCQKYHANTNYPLHLDFSSVYNYIIIPNYSSVNIHKLLSKLRKLWNCKNFKKRFPIPIIFNRLFWYFLESPTHLWRVGFPFNVSDSVVAMGIFLNLI